MDPVTPHDPFPPTDLGSRDRAELVQLAIDYCWALDTGDYETLRRVFAADAIGHLGAGGQQGVDEIIDRVSSALGPLDDSQHMITNHQVAIAGDEATMRCYLHAQHIRAIDGEDGLYVVAGRYEDRCVRTPEGWRIAERELIVMWRTGNPNVFLSPPTL